MTTRRLVVGALVAATGSAIAIGGTKMAWYVIQTRSRTVDIPGLGDTVIQKAPERLTGGEVASWTTPLAVLMLLSALLCFLVGPRLRAVSFAVVIACAPALLVAWLAIGPARAIEEAPRSAGEAVTTSIEPAAGTLITGAGAFLAAVGAVWAWPARRVPRLGMPDVAVENEAAAGSDVTRERDATGQPDVPRE